MDVASKGEAIALANNTPYGEGDAAPLFGGCKHSGFGGRDNGLHAHDRDTETKTIWIDLTDPADGDRIG